MKKIKNISFVSWLVCLIGVIAILPFVILSFYTFPNLEDYAESIIPSIWWHIKFLYLSYDGRYFVAFLFAALNPLKYQSYLFYQLIPIALFILLFASIYAFITSFIKNLTREAQVGLTILIFIFFLHRNPNIPYTFYYMISSYVYLVPLIAFLFFISFTNELFISKNSNFYQLALACVLVFAIAGGNELLLIPTLCWFLYLVFKNQQQKLKKNKELGLLLLSIACAYFLVFTAPGIYNHFDGTNVNRDFIFSIKAFVKTLVYSNIQILAWLKGNYTLLIASIFLIFYLSSHVKYQENIHRYKLLLYTLDYLATIHLLIFPFCWALGDKAQLSYTQIYIILYMFVLLGWFSLIYLASLYFYSKIQSIKYKEKLKPLLFTSFLFLLVIDPRSNITEAYKDWLNGTAKAYSEEMKLNISKSAQATLDQNAVKELGICMLKNKPKTIFSGMYFNQENENFHMAYRVFYKIDQIKVSNCQQ